MSDETTTAAPAQPTPPKGQQFNLKPVETQTLVILRNNQQGAFAAVLSMLATERMGYNVTERTQFVLNAELTSMEISELPVDVPTAGAPAQPETPPEAPKSGAVAAQ